MSIFFRISKKEEHFLVEIQEDLHQTPNDLT